MNSSAYPNTKKLLIWRAFDFAGYQLKIFSKGLISQFANFYYGNTAGFQFNYGSKKELETLRKEFSSTGAPAIPVESVKIANQLMEYGYAVIGKSSSSATITAAAEKAQRALSDESLHGKSPNGASLHMFNPEQVPEIRAVLSNQIRDVLISYFGCAFRINTVRVWRNLHVPGADTERHDVFSNTFHQDNARVTGVKVFVYLTDGVNRDTGAFRFHDSNVSRRIVRSFGYFHRFMQTKRMLRRLTDPKTLHFFEGDRGDCAIVNTQQCLHAASIPKRGSHRDILQFEIYPDKGEIKNIEKLFSTIPPDEEIIKLK